MGRRPAGITTLHEVSSFPYSEVGVRYSRRKDNQGLWRAPALLYTAQQVAAALAEAALGNALFREKQAVGMHAARNLAGGAA